MPSSITLPNTAAYLSDSFFNPTFTLATPILQAGQTGTYTFGPGDDGFATLAALLTDHRDGPLTLGLIADGDRAGFLGTESRVGLYPLLSGGTLESVSIVVQAYRPPGSPRLVDLRVEFYGSVVPEPSSLGLLGLGLAAAGLRARPRANSRAGGQIG